MNTIADRMRARAREIRARLPGYEIYRSDGELAVKLHDDAGYLEELADDLEADESALVQKHEEEVDELEDQIRDKDNEIEKLKSQCASLEWNAKRANARG